MSEDQKAKPMSVKLYRGKIAGRVCAVCGKANGKHTYGFRSTLAANGIAGDKAHVGCVAKLDKAVMRKDKLNLR